MTSRRSTGVILIVSLLAWSVNLRVLACSGIPSRAAVVAQAGTLPAPQPEPSPSRHNCCPKEPKEGKDSRPAQPSSSSKCALHASIDFSCCSLAANPQFRLPFQNSSPVKLPTLSAALAPLTFSHSLPDITNLRPSDDFPGANPGTRLLVLRL